MFYVIRRIIPLVLVLFFIASVAFASYCSQCGNKNPENAKYCTQCGESVSQGGKSRTEKEGLSKSERNEQIDEITVLGMEGLIHIAKRGEIRMQAIVDDQRDNNTLPDGAFSEDGTVAGEISFVSVRIKAMEILLEAVLKQEGNDAEQRRRNLTAEINRLARVLTAKFQELGISTTRVKE